MTTIPPEDRSAITRTPPEIAVAAPRANQPPWASRWGAAGQRSPKNQGGDLQTIQGLTSLLSSDDLITGQENVYFQKEAARMYPERVGTCSERGVSTDEESTEMGKTYFGEFICANGLEENNIVISLARIETPAGLAGSDEAIEDTSIGARQIRSFQETLT